MSTYQDHTDQQLIECLQNEDRLAFSEIYERYWKMLLDTAYHILQDEQEAADAVQNVFISLWTRRQQLQITHLKAFLQQAARFSVFKVIRTKKREAAVYERIRQITSDIIMDDPLVFKEQQNLILELVTNLPEDCQEIFRLSRTEQLTNREIAQKMGISERTVERKLAKSLKFIKLHLPALAFLAWLSTHC